MRWTLTQGPYALNVINDSYKNRRPIPPVFCDLPDYDEDALRVFQNAFDQLCLFRPPMIEGRLQPLTMKIIAEWLQLKKWDDDSEFVDDVLFFIPQMDEVWREIKQKEIDTRRQRERSEKSRQRRLTNKGRTNAE